MSSNKNVNVHSYSIISLHFPLFGIQSTYLTLKSTSSFTCIYILVTYSFFLHMPFQCLVHISFIHRIFIIKTINISTITEYQMHRPTTSMRPTVWFSDIRPISFISTKLIHLLANHNFGSITPRNMSQHINVCLPRQTSHPESESEP